MSEESETYRTAEQPAQDWPDAYLALFGKRLDDDEVAAIETECGNVFRSGLKKWEMTKAVRHCAMNSPSGGRRFPPSGEEIIRAIKAGRYDYQRKQHAVEYTDHSCQMGYGTETYDQWARYLKNATSPMDRWCVICRPFRPEHCQARVKFCEQNGLPFERWKPEEHGFSVAI